MRLPIALGSYKRDFGFLPQLRLRNLILEKTPADAEGIVLMGRPGLSVSYSVPGGNSVAAIWTEPGVFNGDVFTLAGTALYRGSARAGSTNAADLFAQFAALGDQIIFCNSGELYRFDGTLTRPAFPDGSLVCSVAMLDSYFLAVKVDSPTFYWSNVGDGTTWDALSFASAESHPDNLLDIVALSDQLALVGEKSIEFWQPSGNANLPFERMDGLTFSKGTINTGASIYIDNTLVWVGNDGIVYRRGPVPLRLSDHGVEEQITLSGSARLFGFVWEGHTLLVLKLATIDYLYDFETKEWTEASTYGLTNWRAQCGYFFGTGAVFGDAAGPNVLVLNNSALDDAGDLIERRFTCILPDQSVVDNVWLDAQSGIGTEPNGDPILVEMAISRDGGQTFGPFLQTDLGKRGEYRKRAAWRRLGRYDMGAVFDFRCTDPAPFTIQSVRVNEPLAGRSV